MFGDEGGQFASAWIRRALRTTPIEPEVIVPAIEALYVRAGLAQPRVVVVPSPGVMAFAGAFAAKIWSKRATDPSYDAARALSGTISVAPQCKGMVTAAAKAIRAATTLPPRAKHTNNSPEPAEAILSAAYAPADVATVSALSRDVWMEVRNGVEEMEALSYWNECIRDAMRDDFGNPTPTELMTKAASDWAQPLSTVLFGDSVEARDAVQDAANWWQHSQAGNHWLHDTVCIAAARDLRKLNLPEHRSFAVWEASQIHGGYRYLHSEFCLVCDFPESMDETSMDHPTQVRRKSLAQRRAVPVMRWRDGWFV